MLRPNKQLYSNATALRWMVQVAGALSYMHTCRPKVLHRDIKLDNVLLQSAKGMYGTILYGTACHCVMCCGNRVLFVGIVRAGERAVRHYVIAVVGYKLTLLTIDGQYYGFSFLGVLRLCPSLLPPTEHTHMWLVLFRRGS